MNTISPPLVPPSGVSAAVQTAQWTVSKVEALYQLPLMDLLFTAQQVHRENFNPNEIQRSALISIKTGGCSEDCSYCSQSARYQTETEREALMQVEDVVTAAKEAKASTSSRVPDMFRLLRVATRKSLRVVSVPSRHQNVLKERKVPAREKPKSSFFR